MRAILRSTIARAGLGLALAGLLLSAAPAASADGIASVTVDGNTVTVEIALAGGVGADLTIGFEQAVGLTAQNLGLSAELVSPGDLSLAARLPATASIPTAFPVLVTIEPPEEGGLSFAGLASVGLYTHNLLYTVGSPLRLYSAPLGGSFVDITEEMGSGSYRVRGAKGDFSQFLIVADTRPVDTAIGEKLDRADALLAANLAAIDPMLAAQLDGHLDSARSFWQNGQTVPALNQVESFLKKLAKADPAELPDVWRASRDLVDVAGLLRAAGETLRFSLTLKSNNL